MTSQRFGRVGPCSDTPPMGLFILPKNRHIEPESWWVNSLAGVREGNESQFFFAHCSYPQHSELLNLTPDFSFGIGDRIGFAQCRHSSLAKTPSWVWPLQDVPATMGNARRLCQRYVKQGNVHSYEGENMSPFWTHSFQLWNHFHHQR